MLLFYWNNENQNFDHFIQQTNCSVSYLPNLKEIQQELLKWEANEWLPAKLLAPYIISAPYLFCTQNVRATTWKCIGKTAQNHAPCTADIQFRKCKHITRFAWTWSFWPSKSLFSSFNNKWVNQRFKAKISLMGPILHWFTVQRKTIQSSMG